MDFKEQLPVWKAEGVAPPETKQNEGWKIGDKPPADWFNYMWSRTYYSLDEVREKVKQEVDNLKQSVSDGKKKVSVAITDKGVETAPGATFDVMANNISKIETDPSIGTTNAATGDLLEGKKMVSQGELMTGAMPNNGALSKTITTQGGTHKIMPGYYSGGEVKAQFNNLTSDNIKWGVHVGGIKGSFTNGVSLRHGTLSGVASSNKSISLTGDNSYQDADKFRVPRKILDIKIPEDLPIPVEPNSGLSIDVRYARMITSKALDRYLLGFVLRNGEKIIDGDLAHFKEDKFTNDSREKYGVYSYKKFQPGDHIEVYVSDKNPDPDNKYKEIRISSVEFLANISIEASYAQKLARDVATTVASDISVKVEQ